MDISVVIPLFNEEESLPELMDWIARVMDANKFHYEVIMVDDGSTDSSWSVICKLGEKYPQVRGVRFQRNNGKSAALHVGFQRTRGRVVITMDADLQDSPDEIPELYRMIVEDKYDLVSGYKAKRYDPITKTVPTKLFNAATRWVSGIKNLHDFNCGLKSYRREVVKSVEVYGEMHRYIPVMAKAAGFPRIAEKVVEHRPRKYGVTKFGLNRFVRGFLDLISIAFITRYMKRPMHFFGLWGMFFAIMGGSTLLYLLVKKILIMAGAISGGGIGGQVPALFFGSTSFLLGILLLATGLLAELIGRVSSTRNDYQIAEEIGKG
jgi:glycosyltransferase involved in cell wall biosynthesis